MNDGTKPDSQPRDPFAVDVERALDALALAWGDDYDSIGIRHDGRWYAHLRHAHLGYADEDDCGDACHDLTGSTPDELNRAIRADCIRRGAL